MRTNILRRPAMYVPYNANPLNNNTIDCTIRAISRLTNKSWDAVYVALAVEGFIQKDLPNSNRVWGKYLQENGFVRDIIPNTCPVCYTVNDFCVDHPYGAFLLVTGDHVIAVIDGNYYDTWDSGQAVPVYYWTKGE